MAGARVKCPTLTVDRPRRAPERVRPKDVLSTFLITSTSSRHNSAFGRPPPPRAAPPQKREARRRASAPSPALYSPSCSTDVGTSGCRGRGRGPRRRRRRPPRNGRTSTCRSTAAMPPTFSAANVPISTGFCEPRRRRRQPPAPLDAEVLDEHLLARQRLRQQRHASRPATQPVRRSSASSTATRRRQLVLEPRPRDAADDVDEARAAILGAGGRGGVRRGEEQGHGRDAEKLGGPRRRGRRAPGRGPAWRHGTMYCTAHVVGARGRGYGGRRRCWCTTVCQKLARHR